MKKATRARRKPVRYVNCRIAYGGLGGDFFARCVAVNSVFCVWEARTEVSTEYTFSLTHRQTGYRAGLYRSVADAKKAAKALLKTYPLRSWRFSDPLAAKKFKDAPQIVTTHGGINA